MASSSAVYQCSNSPRPLIAGHRRDSIGRRPLSVWIPNAALSRRKLFRHIPASAAGSTLPLPFVNRRICFYVVASSSTVETPPAASRSNFIDALERCFAASPDFGPSSSTAGAMLSPTMKKEYGAYGAATLEKSKLDLSQKTTKSSPELATGGGGGDIGKKNFHGGGDGGDDDGDDDDYFDDFDDGDEGDDGGWFRKRIVLKEFFDRKFIDAVFNEWYKTMADLPGGLRQACEMGLVSSAQLVHFLSINARPTTSRLISRALSPSLSRAFIGR